MGTILDYIVGFVLGILSGMVWTKLENFRFRIKVQKVQDKFNKSAKAIRTIEDESDHFQLGCLKIEIIPWLSIQENFVNGWFEKDCKYAYKKVFKKNLPNDLSEIIESHWRTEIAFNRKLENGPRVGLLSLKIVTDGQNKTKPEFEFYNTNYKSFIGTNKCLDKFNHKDLISYNSEKIGTTLGYEYLKDSLFSNDLATATTIITKDRKILLSKRTGKVHVLPNIVHTSIAEGMLPDEDVINDIPNPFMTVIRGAKEELKITVSIEEIRLLGIGLYLPFSQPFCVFQIESNKTFQELYSEAGETMSSWEGYIFPIEYDLETLVPFLLDTFSVDQNIKVAGLARYCITLCLAHTYGFNSLEKRIKDVKKLLQY